MVNKLTTYSVLQPFCTRPKESIHLADIAREVGAPHVTVRLKLAALEKQGILHKEYRGRQTLHKLNKDHPNIIEYLVIAEKEKLLQKCQEPLLRELVEFTRKKKRNISVVLFGSGTINSETAHDFDLLIEGNIERKEFDEFEEIWGKHIQALILPDLGETTKLLRNEVIKKHLIIQGSENIIRWMLS